jgi:hypothetical protein
MILNDKCCDVMLFFEVSMTVNVFSDKKDKFLNYAYEQESVSALEDPEIELDETAGYRELKNIPDVYTLEDVYELLHPCYESGEDVYCNYAGDLFFSDKCENIDYVYQTSLGVTHKEYMEEVNRFNNRALEHPIKPLDLQKLKEEMIDK